MIFWKVITNFQIRSREDVGILIFTLFLSNILSLNLRAILIKLGKIPLIFLFL